MSVVVVIFVAVVGPLGVSVAVSYYVAVPVTTAVVFALVVASIVVVLRCCCQCVDHNNNTDVCTNRYENDQNNQMSERATLAERTITARTSITAASRKSSTP